MADEEINTEGGGAVSGSVGTGKDFIGRDAITNNNTYMPVPTEQQQHNHLVTVVSKLEARVAKVEELLGGYLGIPGLTQELMGVKHEISEIKDELRRTYVPPSQYIYMIFSSVALFAAIAISIFSLWR